MTDPKASPDVPMRVAYADPPYLGQGKKYDHPDARKWDSVDAHIELVHRLSDNYDAWAMSLSVPSLRVILPHCPEQARVLAWVKPFAAFKKNVNPAAAWEPVVVCGCRRRGDKMTYMRDWCAEPITLKKGLTGAKPERFCFWLFDAMNLLPGDTLDDVFPGTGVVGRCWEKYEREYPAHASWVNRVQSKWELVKGTTR